jgi:hypothetical protein
MKTQEEQKQTVSQLIKIEPKTNVVYVDFKKSHDQKSKWLVDIEKFFDESGDK